MKIARSSARNALFVAAFLLGPAVAVAATPDRCQDDAACRELSNRAAQLAGQTKYQESMALYQSAYELVHEPRLLMNLGRCQFRLGRARKALELYASFQKAEPNPDPQIAARLDQFITEAKAAIESETAAPVVEPPAVTVKPPAPPPAVVEQPRPAEPPVHTPGRLVLGRPLYRVVLGSSLLGVGLVAAGLGIGALSANGTCVATNDAVPGQCLLSVGSDGRPYTRTLDGITPGVPLLVLGVAFAAGGIALIAVPPRKSAKP